MESVGSVAPPCPPRAMGDLSGKRLRVWNCGVNATYWDNLRKDPELWLEQGECPVYLYERGASRRGPSMKTTREMLRRAQCAPLLEVLAQRSALNSNASARIDSVKSITATQESRFEPCDLYLAAPRNISPEEAFHYHVSTRNFFAWLHGKPLVGRFLGEALVELVTKMHVFRASKANNYQDLLVYLHKIGYARMANNPDNALALLYLAENLQVRSLWIEAFTHCVGMKERLPESNEYQATSRLNKALIARAHLRMDLALSRTSESIEKFLEEELCRNTLGLGAKAAQDLEEFRSFLKYYYASSNGCWPPKADDGLPMVVFRSMVKDFQELYDMLADKGTNGTESPPAPLSRGTMVLQGLDTFNKKQGFKALPYYQPVLPRPRAAETRYQSYRGVSSIRPARESLDDGRRSSVSTTVHPSQRTMEVNGSFVRAFKRFETELSHSGQDRISIAEARKVRWILVYGMLQMLLSATGAPREVNEKDVASYPLCCPLVGLPHWDPERSLACTEFEQEASIAHIRDSLEPKLSDTSDSAYSSSENNEDMALRNGYASKEARERATSSHPLPSCQSTLPGSRKVIPPRTSSTRGSLENAVSQRREELLKSDMVKASQQPSKGFLSRIRPSKAAPPPSPYSEEEESYDSTSSVYPQSRNSSFSFESPTSDGEYSSSVSSEEIQTPNPDLHSFFELTNEIEPFSKKKVSFAQGDTEIPSSGLFIRSI